MYRLLQVGVLVLPHLRTITIMRKIRFRLNEFDKVEENIVKTRQAQESRKKSQQVSRRTVGKFLPLKFFPLLR